MTTERVNGVNQDLKIAIGEIDLQKSLGFGKSSFTCSVWLEVPKRCNKKKPRECRAIIYLERLLLSGLHKVIAHLHLLALHLDHSAHIYHAVITAAASTINCKSTSF